MEDGLRAQQLRPEIRPGDKEEAGRDGAASSSTSQFQSPREPKKRVKVYPEKITRVRAKRPKTRSGCRTCKIRRVKCDETKPSCQRCTKFGVSCDGYMSPQPPANKKALLPRLECPPAMPILPITALFKDQNEYQYWLYFRDEIANDLSGHTATKCWNYVVLQACNESPTLRYLTIALAALSKSQRSLSFSTSHHEFAFKKYGQALRSIQEMISSRNDLETIRTTLIASLLIFSFETMDGNAEQAVKHAKASLAMMRKQLQTHTRKYSQIRALSSIPGLEDEVTEVFVRLDLTIMSGIQGNQPHRNRQSALDMMFIDEHFYMPHLFGDLREAKGYLEHFQFRAMPYLSHLTDIFMYGDKYAPPVPESAYELLQSQLQQWYASFRPLFERACRPGNKDFVGAAMLRCLALGTDISVQRVCMKVHTRPAELFEAEAQEIIDLSRRVIRDQRFKNSFGFDCGIVPSLFIAIMICRKREIRQQAIEILRMTKGRVEVIWDASKIAEVGERMLRAEELGETVLPS